MTPARRNIMLGTAGHVDHGKTALVKLLTGCETDTMAEEKQRGLTIDLGFAPCQLSDQRVVGVVDVPGHVDFIRNMVAGAHGIDVVIFVVAADDGIMPQTHEHLHILTLMGLRHGLVALTKVDLVDEARRAFVIQELRRLLANTFLANAPICPLSNITGEGFEGFFDALNAVVAQCGNRPCSGGFRLWVEDVFTIRGSGTVITGIPNAGRVRPGDPVHLLPAGRAGRVRQMQVYGEDADEGRAGECVALNVPDLDHNSVRRGMVLSDSDAVAPVTMIEAELRTLDALPGTVEDYLDVHFHVGTAAAMARVAMLEQTEMTAGQRQMVQLRLAEPLPLVPGERFVVRANISEVARGGLTTIGGGRILGISNARLRRKKPWTLSALGARREALDDPARWCELMVRESATPIANGDLARKCFCQAEELGALLETLRREERISQTPSGAWLHREVVAQTAADLLAEIQSFHAAEPQRAGLDPQDLRLKPDPALLDQAVAMLVQQGHIQRRGSVLAAANWRAQVPDRDQQLSEQVEARLQQAGFAPPGLEEIAAALREPLSRIQTAARLLAERGRVVRLDDRVWIHSDTLEAGKQTALKLFRRAPRFSTMEFRDALGVSRKYAVPLLDHLDKLRFTVRSGHDRTPGAEAKKLLAPPPA